MDPLEQPVQEQALLQLYRQGLLSQEAWSEARRWLLPPPIVWAGFLDRMLALLGGVLMASGVLYLLAFNWDELGRFEQLLSLILIFLSAAGIAVWRGTARPSGQAALYTAALLVGGLLAWVGQTYQTGADPYTLFLAWAILLLPWAVAAQLTGLWFFIGCISEVALVLYWQQVLHAPGTAGQVYLVHLVTLYSLLLAGGAELGLGRTRGVRWPSYVWFAVGLWLQSVTLVTLLFLPNWYNEGASWSLPAFFLLQGYCFGVGFWLRRDRVLVGIGALGVLIVTTALLGKIAFEVGEAADDPFGWTVLLATCGVVVAAKFAAVIYFLRRIQPEGT